MNATLRILHLEDDWRDAELIRRLLISEGLAQEVSTVETEEDFTAGLRAGAVDLILSDYTLPGFDGMNALRLSKELLPAVPFIFVSGTIDEELAVESLKQGATDYVFKNRLSRLGPAVRRALRELAERNESQQAEAAMRESEHKYRQLFESLGDAAFLTQVRTGRIVDTNHQGELLLGRPRAQIIGESLARFQCSPQFEDNRRRFEAVPAPAAPLDYEDTIARPDGTRVPVSIRVTPLVLYGRQLMLGLYRDITRNKLAEQQIQEQARLLDLDPDAIIVWDMEGRVQYWNEGAARLYGWSKTEILGRRAAALLDQDQSEIASAQEAVIAKGAWSGDLHHVAKDGHRVLVHSRWILVRDEQGRPKSILLVNIQANSHEHNRLEPAPMSSRFG